MTGPARLPALGEAQYFWYCHRCIEATYHNPDGTCKQCGEKTPHIPRDEGKNGKRR